MKLFNKILATFLVCITLLGCTIDASSGDGDGDSNSKTPDIYLAGTGTNGKAVYWKNGTAVVLSNESSKATGIALSGDDVYVSGTEGNPSRPVYWKNGTVITLPTIGSLGTEITGIAVSGNDVYVSGYESVNPVYPVMTGVNSVARYWKNGTGYTISTTINNTPSGFPSISGFTTGIAAIGNDAYISGSQVIAVATLGTFYTPRYWKNGSPLSLSFTSGQKIQYTTAIAVSGNDVYVAGYDFNGLPANLNILWTPRYVAKYWKNGTEIILKDGTNGIYTTAIAISGNDVYVAGYDNVAKYWKNGTEVILTDGSRATAIAISGNDVYVAGVGVGGWKYWKNGVSTAISDASNITAIAVK